MVDQLSKTVQTNVQYVILYMYMYMYLHVHVSQGQIQHLTIRGGFKCNMRMRNIAPANQLYGGGARGAAALLLATHLCIYTVWVGYVYMRQPTIALLARASDCLCFLLLRQSIGEERIDSL